MLLEFQMINTSNCVQSKSNTKIPRNSFGGVKMSKYLSNRILNGVTLIYPRSQCYLFIDIQMIKSYLKDLACLEH